MFVATKVRKKYWKREEKKQTKSDISAFKWNIENSWFEVHLIMLMVRP